MRLSVLHPSHFFAGVRRLSRRAQTRRGAGNYCIDIINIIRETIMRNPDRRQLPVERARQQARYHAEDKRAQAHRSADYARRLRAAGFDREPYDYNEDMDRYRLELTRRISMFLNDWEGCPLRLCQRMQGCMAPESTCANHADDPPMTREQWDVVKVEVRRALDAEIEARGGRDAVEAAAEEEARAADKTHQKL
jgi:hypothetical protein